MKVEIIRDPAMQSLRDNAYYWKIIYKVEGCRQEFQFTGWASSKDTFLNGIEKAKKLIKEMYEKT